MLFRRPGFSPNTNNNTYERKNYQVALSLLIITVIATLASNIWTGKQLHMASEQWDSLRNDKKQNDAEARLKNIQALDQYRKDTMRVGVRDRFQVKSFERQLEIYKSQMLAMNLQAAIAKQQFEFQNEINLEQKINNKPVFSIQSSSYDTINKKCSFIIHNTGHRKAMIFGMKVCAFNKKDYSLRVNLDSISKSELNEISYSNIFLDLPKWEYDDKETIFYIFFRYKDASYKEIQKFKKFFTFEIKSNNAFEYKEINYKDKTLIYSIAKNNNYNME
jgi:hypothetical protein